MSAWVLVLALFVGVAVGIFSAYLGVGGAPIMVPFLVFAAGLSQHAAEGTALAVIIPTALAGTLAHRTRGYVALRAAALLAAGGVAGALAGARLALRLDADLLQGLFGGFLLTLGVILVVGSLREQGR